MGNRKRLNGQFDADPNQLQVWAKLTKLSDLVSSSKQIDQDTRQVLLSAISQTQEVLRSINAQDSKYRRWTEILERETTSIKRSKFSLDATRGLYNSLKKIRREAKR